ncbi:hypothetical protein [Actinoallomurus rhizosphaericola]|nr:hypothetical protein [Actinoallomurus rhizosphaericola]
MVEPDASCESPVATVVNEDGTTPSGGSLLDEIVRHVERPEAVAA